MALTDRAVRAAKVEPPAKEKMIADGNGLYLRVRPGDAPKVWLFRYTLDGKTRKMQLGTFPLLTLAGAREEAAKLAALTKQGIDPVAEREAAAAALEAERKAAAAALEAETARRITVAQLFERWASVDLVRRKDEGAEVRRMFAKDVLPIIGALPVEDVRKGHVTGVTDKLLARGVPRMAKVIFSLMRQMFRFAVDRDMIEFEPTAALRKAAVGGKDTERDRVLSEDEIKVLVRQLPKAGMSESAQSAVWIAFATCCRIGELMAARWENIDFDRQTWLIPAENSKNGKSHIISLSGFALARLQALKDAADEAAAKARKKQPEATRSAWVFPNRQGTGPVCPKTVTKQLGDRQRPDMLPMKGRARAELAATLALVGGKWGPHDLRRTGATMMVQLGVLPEVAERCLNHTEQNKVKRIYQRHSYENEMREAWRLLGERLELLTRTDAGNVITLNRAA